MFSGLYQKIKINLLRIKPWSTNSNLPLKPLCSPLEFVTLVRFKFLCNSCHDDATTTTTTRRMKTYSGTNRNLYSKFLHKQLFRNRYLLVRSFDRSFDDDDDDDDDDTKIFPKHSSDFLQIGHFVKTNLIREMWLATTTKIQHTLKHW